MSFVPVNPRPMLQDLVNKPVSVRLKWNDTDYRGRLVSVDSYMNLQLAGAEEYIDNKQTGSLGSILIRCVVDSCSRGRRSLPHRVQKMMVIADSMR